MRFYACEICLTCYQVAGEVDELTSLWSVIEQQGVIHCPTQRCSGHLVRLRGPVTGSKFRRRDIPLPTFFRAVNGFGSPDGSAASAKRFRKLITSKRVTEVVADPVGQPERVILKRLVLEGGTVLHFDTSSRGACCYYIEEPGPSCLEVLENEFSSESLDSNREKAGRVVEACDPHGPTAGDGCTSEAAAVERAKSGGVSSLPTSSELSKSD